MRTCRFAAALLLILFGAGHSKPAPAGQPGITIERSGDGAAVNQADRDRLARTIFRHDFENPRDPDTGQRLPSSASLGRNNWPDFWEPIRAVGFPEYLIPLIAIAPDTSGHVPGIYRDEYNHVLRIPYDGSRVGLRTRIPLPVNPALAYEFSLMERDEGLEGARIRAGVDWMRLDPEATEILRSDEIPNLEPGQEDWPAAPFRMRINDPPPGANAARMFVILERETGLAGGSRNGTIWLDDIALRPLPKISVGAPRQRPGGGGERVIPIRYVGLADNIPDPANPGYFRGRRYTRLMEATDVFNQPLARQERERLAIAAGDNGEAEEEIAIPPDRFGVYYLNIRLYGADDNLAADAIRTVAVLPPAGQARNLAASLGKPAFGIRAGAPSASELKNPDWLARALLRTGARMTKIIPWPAIPAGPDDPGYRQSLVEAIRSLKKAGIGITGVISPPPEAFGQNNLAQAIIIDGEKLNSLLAEAARELGLFLDGWQWGDDADGSLAGMPENPNFEKLSATLTQFAGGLPLTQNRILGAEPPAPFPRTSSITEGFLPASTPIERLWPEAAAVFPWLFEPYLQEWGRIYPPPELSRLAPPPPVDQIDRQAREKRRTASWISLELLPTNANEPDAAAERKQMEDLLIRAVQAAILAPDAVFLGDLADPGRGLLRRDDAMPTALEARARPAYLAATVVAELLEGAEYLGRLSLLPPFEAHVFRRAGTDNAVIALWQNGDEGEKTLPRREIAEGPPLFLVDWAGNRAPLPSPIPVRRTPCFITGLSAGLALTRMSVRLNPASPLWAKTTRQNQRLEMINHMNRQASALFRLRYAANLRDGAMENGWTVAPQELRLDLPPAGAQTQPANASYAVTPDPNSPVQFAAPNQVDKNGLKVIQANMGISAAMPADFLLYIPFQLRSDLDVDIEPIVQTEASPLQTLLLRVRWFPEAASRRRGDLQLTPFFIKRGRMKEAAPFPVTVPPSPPGDRNRPDAGFVTVELRIPRFPRLQTWVGFSEVDGPDFYLADVTDYLTEPPEIVE